MEVYFEYSVESETISDGMYDTPNDSLEAAQKRWQEMCDDGDYEYGVGDAIIYCVHDGDVLMKGDYTVYSEHEPDEQPYLQSEFI